MAVLSANEPVVTALPAEQHCEELVYARPQALTDVYTHYCPGCTHGIAHRLVAEVIDELGIRQDTILVASVGCSVFAYNYFEVDSCEAAHGRAPAMATGVKRVHPDKVVFTYQGDGDLASIGMGEIMHVAARGEKITTIFVNNAVYGMTGGQMAPTSLPGQVTTSSPFGRDVRLCGPPHYPGQEGHSHRLRSPIEGAGLQRRRTALHVPHQLGHDRRRLSELGARQHDPHLPTGGLQGRAGTSAKSQVTQQEHEEQA